MRYLPDWGTRCPGFFPNKYLPGELIFNPLTRNYPRTRIKKRAGGYHPRAITAVTGVVVPALTVTIWV